MRPPLDIKVEVDNISEDCSESKAGMNLEI